MRNILKIKLGAKFHITSYRVWALWASRWRVLSTQKLNFLQKWPNLQGRLELIWRSFFRINDFFCVILSFWDIVSLSNYCVHIFFLSVLGHFFLSKNDVHLKICKMLWSELLYSGSDLLYAQKKLFKQKMGARTIPIFPANWATFGRSWHPNAIWCDMKFHAHPYFQHIAYLYIFYVKIATAELGGGFKNIRVKYLC